MIRVRNNHRSLVILAGNSAYKRFKGPHADAMRENELAGLAAAKTDQTWSRFLLACHPARFGFLVSRRGEPLADHHTGEMRNIVDLLTGSGLMAGREQAAHKIIDIGTLTNVLTATGDREIVEELKSMVRNLTLPAGPTHGDLHRRNFLALDGELKIIDFDRFRLDSCPLFDRLHFELAEARLEHKRTNAPRKWLDMLENRTDIVISVSGSILKADQLALAYGMQRIAGEGKNRLLSGSDMTKYAGQARRLLKIVESLRSSGDTMSRLQATSENRGR